MQNTTTKRRNHRKSERGAVLLLTTLALMFIIFPLAGLAIDAGVAFAVQARLQTAVDGAALSAARSLSRGVSLSQQVDSAERTAREVFAANLQNTLSAGDPGIEISWPPAPPKTVSIRVDGTAIAPTYFMMLFGHSSTRVAASATSTRRDVNIVLVLDRSGSIENMQACDDLRSAAKSFVETFVDGRDRLALVTFGTTYRTDFAPTFSFKSGGTSIIDRIDAIRCVGGTNSVSAYWTAWQHLQTINEQNTLNVILFFTDGQPNTLHMGNLAIKANCNDQSARNGVITPAGTAVWGIFQALEPNPAPARNPDWVLIPNKSGCDFASRFADVINDVTSLAPAGAANEKDVFGNSLTGYKTVRRDANSRIRINDWETVTNAATNALDNAAQRVRTLSTAAGLDVYTYCVALGGAPAPAEHTLMQRVANTKASPIYNSAQPLGMYVQASTPGQLEQAFSQLASDILRIAR